MDILDALEQKVNELLEELEALRAENSRLGNMLAVSSSLEAGPTKQPEQSRINTLEVMLDKEKAIRKTVLAQIDALIKRIEENSITG